MRICYSQSLVVLNYLTFGEERREASSEVSAVLEGNGSHAKARDSRGELFTKAHDFS